MVHKTFYLEKTNNKCHVNNYDVDGETHSDLVSFETRVASYNHTTNEIDVYGWYSATTGRHINAFLEFYGFDTMTKNELFKKYNLKK